MTEHTGAELFFVVVEKILAAHEHLREDWPIAGTTGYEFLNRVHGLFVDPEGEGPLRRVSTNASSGSRSRSRKLPTSASGRSWILNWRASCACSPTSTIVSRKAAGSPVITLVGLRQALREVVACFPVYRTYVNPNGASQQDRRDIEWAVTHARRRSVRADKTVFDFIHAALTTDLSSGPSPYNRREVRLAMKFQQYTGPVAAKGSRIRRFTATIDSSRTMRWVANRHASAPLFQRSTKSPRTPAAVGRMRC